MKVFQLPRKSTSDRLRKSNQRSRNRIPARYHAYLHAATGAVISDCLVKDISETGARIILPEAARLPKQIMLRVTGEATPMRASVVWQAGAKCGLEFRDAGSV